MALNAVYRPWEGHQDAKDAVTTLSYGGYMLSTLRFVGASTEVVQGELALQAIGAYGGETVAAEPVVPALRGGVRVAGGERQVGQVRPEAAAGMTTGYGTRRSTMAASRGRGR